jgi:hypothetical protein
MDDKSGSVKFQKRMLVKEVQKSGFVSAEQRQQFVVVNIAGGDKKQPGRTFAKLETQLEIGVLGDQDAAGRIRLSKQGRIRCPVFPREILRMKHLMPSFAEPSGEPAR